MMIGMLGLIVLALLLNIGYYEYRYPKSIDKDTDLIKPYFILARIKRGRQV